MDGNIVENIIKYCETSTIADVLIDKMCNIVKSTLLSASLVWRRTAAV